MASLFCSAGSKETTACISLPSSSRCLHGHILVTFSSRSWALACTKGSLPGGSQTRTILVSVHHFEIPRYTTAHIDR